MQIDVRFSWQKGLSDCPWSGLWSVLNGPFAVPKEIGGLALNRQRVKSKKKSRLNCENLYSVAFPEI